MKRREARRPVQERAKRRREALLDATARILDRGGYDALTTNAVAHEAGASIGALYEYFPSREALLIGLLERYRARLDAETEAALATAGDDVGAAADAMVDMLARLWREPGYRALWLATQVSPLLAETGAAWADASSARIASALVLVAPTLTPSQAQTIARTAVHLASALVLVAIQAPARRRRAMLSEAKFALRAYLVARLAAT